ncbi:MAG TPA: protein kinase [Steroidobacteraceae bacterium]|jgi:serine/threonine protein kinase/Flp pilus assembly protein TadD|nr:protein kinase [Steroidobacteraceae bacterium]
MRMTASQMALMSRLLDEALPLDEAGRRRWLEALPAQYRDLLTSLREALLPEFAPSPAGRSFATFLESADADESGRAEPTGLQPGERVGPYELIQLLGAGGMAEVWLAKRADGVFKRDVALKLPSHARVRRDLEQRFARERDILASLEHPHIARLYDAGIDPHGLPYLSMEYVQGELFTDWCDAQRLDIRARLRLFLQVLGAVQYAHGRQVIHRDIKPSNILVTKGEVRLLDFGVATLLDDGAAAAGKTPLTSVYGHALTPIYSSPEVIRGDPVTAMSDIYSLGVVLFELLTGDRPYRLNAGASRAMLENAIAAAEVHKPSTQIVQDAWGVRGATHEQLTRQLRGDIDIIALKALEKDPQNRYASAAAMADDVQRFLDGKPIKAQPPRLAYRFGKFLRRNRLVVSVAAAAMLVVLATLLFEFERQIELARETNSVYVRRPISEKSIAVLPFQDMSENKDQGYFSDGLSEELITLLAQIQDLQVIARTSSFHFKNKDVPLSEIASTLGVAHVLEGSVRHAGSTVRVTAQLIRTADGVQLWSQTFDRDVKDIFKVQDDIAAAVVGSLKLKLLAPGSDPHRSDNPEAYNDYLLARQFGRRGNLEDIERAVASYRKAIELDPGYAAAYAGLSFTQTAIANSTQDAARFALARDAADKALQLAPQLVDGYRARALFRLETLDFAGARADSEKALSLAPGESAVQSLYGVQIAALGKIPQAITAMNKAIDLDPLSSYAWANVGLFQTVNHDYIAARRALERALAINPTADADHYLLGQLDMLQGRLPEAQAEFQKLGLESHRRMGYAMVEYAGGHEKQSQQALNEIIAKHAADMAYQVGDVYAWRGDKDKAFEWLERAYQQHDSGLNGIAYDPLLVSLQSDARYGALLKKLELADNPAN